MVEATEQRFVSWLARSKGMGARACDNAPLKRRWLPPNSLFVDRVLEAVALPVTVLRLGNKMAARPCRMGVHDEVKFGDNPRRCRSTFCVQRGLTVIGWIMEELQGTGPEMPATAGISLGATAGLLSSRA